MDALVPAFIVALLAELGDRTQLLAMLLGSRFRAPAAVLAGIAVAAIVNMGIAGAVGMEIAALIPHRAVQLMTGLALLLAASGAMLRVKPAPSVDRWTLGAFASSAETATGFARKSSTTISLPRPFIFTKGRLASALMTILAAVRCGERTYM